MNSIDLGKKNRICDVIALTLLCHQDPFGANLFVYFLVSVQPLSTNSERS